MISLAQGLLSMPVPVAPCSCNGINGITRQHERQHQFAVLAVALSDGP